MTVFTAWLSAPGAIADVAADSTALAGVALWDDAGGSVPAADAIKRDDGPPEVRSRALPARERFRTYVDSLGALHARVIPQAHWTLSLLGVDPAHRGRGHGSALRAHRLALIRAAGLPWYLTTGSARNVACYQRRQFCVIEQGLVPRTGVRFWALRRD